MSRVFNQIEVGLDEDLEEKLQWLMPNYGAYHVLKKSLDARKRRQAPQFIYNVEIFAAGEDPTPKAFHFEKVEFTDKPVIIIGSGPAGLFAALRLIERGIPCLLFEQGGDCAARIKAIAKFWRHGELDPRSNVGFGEGGAGLFSDGKLITRIKSPHIPYVMQRLVQFGAPPEICYAANPHVGSDRIRRIIPVMREYLQKNGCQIFFNTKVSGLITTGAQITGVQLEDGRSFRSGRVILACGHSAEDFFHHLAEIGVTLEGKSFAVGLRIEHPQELINRLQYGEYVGHPKLETANYKLAHTDPQSQIGVYSFCMCPGGYVLSSGTSADGVVANGMSNFHRNSPFANAAVVVSIDYEKTFGADPFAGLTWRRKIENDALNMVLSNGGKKELPAQGVEDFLLGRLGKALPTSCPSGVVAARLDQLLGPDMNRHLRSGLEKFEEWMKGFISPHAQFHGVESRTSCPLRIRRNPSTLQSISHLGLYPAGEGAGYAGGITSAACDGVAIAEAIVAEVSAQVTMV